MPTSSISGLASGLDTAGIIDQLMQLEAISQNRLKAQQSTQKSVLTALQSLNTDLASLATKAEALAKPETWQTLKGSSTNPLITVTTGAAPVATSFSVTVTSVASAAQTLYADKTALDADVVTGAVTLTDADGTTHPIATTGTTLADLAKGINDAKAGVTATTVQTAPGLYQLQLTASATGAGSTNISLSGVNLTAASAGSGQDAAISIGSLGLTATSKSNTFTDLTPVSPSPSPTGPSAATTPTTSTVTVAQDATGVKAERQGPGRPGQRAAHQDRHPDRQRERRHLGRACSPATPPSAACAAPSSTRSSAPAAPRPWPSLGIQTDRYGKLVFDEAKFDAAYAADPTGVAAQFTKGATSASDGWAARLQSVAKTASDPFTGTITSAIQGRQATIDRLGDDITDWDDRLALRRESLTRQFTALETALSTMQSQGNWLAGQIAQLPTSSSS